jgi:crotonobetainyl-CoA:carnitine CoA-transferase CaiB-like acyl-CoA transferase
MSAPLAGLVILEQPGGVATRYCGKLFAAHGATVLQSGAADATGVGYGGAASEAYAAWLDHGKQRVGTYRSAFDKVDLVIAGQSAVQVAEVDAALADVPNTLRLGITWFASDGPYRDWVASDAVIQAMSGVAYATGPKDGPPMLPRGHAPQVVGGATAFIAALAALIGRDEGWAGRRVDIDILSANLCFSEGGASTLALTRDKVTRRGVNRFTPTFPGGIYPARDGWIGVTALTPAQWSSLCDMIGRPELARDPRNRVTLQRLDRADELDPILIRAFQSMSAAYLLTEGQRRRIPLAPVPSLAELPRTPHWQGRGSFAPVGGAPDATGPTMPFRFETRAADPSPAAKAATAPDLPLRGVRVLDLSMGWAGPLAARHFADLGADVVKVESCTHYDWWRGFDGLNDGDPPPYEIRHSFLMVNRNKRGITLDLKSETGKTLLRRLAARSDVMIENYAPGVLDRMGIGPTAMADAVPGLIAISMGAFGASGPWSGFRAYGSTVEQASGLPFANGEPADPPTMQHVAYGDPIGGLYGAVACLIALYGRRHGRAGTVIDLGQVECLFQLGADAIIAQSTRADPLPRTGSRHPLSALRMIAGDDSPAAWWAASAETAAHWNAVARVVGRVDLLAPEGTDVATLKSRELDMEQAVRTWAASRPVTEVVRAFQAAGVPAGPVYAAQDLLTDPQLVASGFWRRVGRRFIGSHVAPLAPYRLDSAPPPVWGAAPTLGEHNEPVLGGDLGLTPDELEALAADGVIGTRAVAG